MRRFPRPAAVVLGAAMLLAVASVAAQENPAAPSAPPAPPPAARSLEPPAGALVAAGNAPDVIFLYTGDVIGYIEPCG